MHSIGAEDTADGLARKVSDLISSLKGEGCDPGPCTTADPLADYPGKVVPVAARHWDADTQPLDTIAFEATYNQPVVVADSRGTVTAFWRRTLDGPYFTSRRTLLEERWSPPHQLAPQRQGVWTGNLTAVTAPNGEVTAAWMVSKGRDNDEEIRPMVAHCDGAGNWSVRALPTPQNLPQAGSPELAVDSRGVVTAVTLDSAGARLYANRFDPASGSWSGPEIIAQDVRGSWPIPAAAAGTDGTVVAAWMQNQGDESGELRWVRFNPATQSWSAPAVIATGIVTAPALAYDDISGFTLAYSRANQPLHLHAPMVTRMAPLARVWSQAVQVGDYVLNSRGFNEAAKLISTAGRTVLLYPSANTMDAVHAQGPYAPWSSPQSVAGAVWSVQVFPIGMDALGNISVLDPLADLSQVRYDAASTTWNQKQPIPGASAAEGIKTSYVGQAVDPAGVVTTVWSGLIQVNGVGSYVVQSKRFK